MKRTVLNIAVKVSIAGALALILAVSIFPIASTSASSTVSDTAGLTAAEISFGQHQYVVQQQPADGETYVSPSAGTVTQFQTALNRWSSIGILAHNNLAGASFFSLEVGDRITVEFDNGLPRDFEVYDIRQYQDVSDDQSFSLFDQVGDGSNDVFSTLTVMSAVYGNAGYLTLQTCIARGNSSHWGVEFVLARPVKKPSQPAKPNIHHPNKIMLIQNQFRPV